MTTNNKDKQNEEIKKGAKDLFTWAMGVYVTANGWLGNVVILNVARLFGAKEDGRFMKLMSNIYVANFFYVVTLYFLSTFLFYPFSMICYYWAMFNIFVILLKILNTKNIKPRDIS